MKTIFLIIAIALAATAAQAQTDGEPASDIKMSLKKKKGKIGLLKGYNDMIWWIEPEYDKVTGMYFSPNSELIYSKFWKGNTFDIVKWDKEYYKKDNKPQFVVLAKNVTEIIAFPENSRNIFFAYKSGDKWGCSFYGSLYGTFYDTDIPPVYSAPPVRLFWDKEYRASFYLIVQSGNLSGLLTMSGKAIIEPGEYSDFKLEGQKSERNLYGTTPDYKFIEITGKNKLKGYAIPGSILPPVLPQYVSIEVVTKGYNYFICTLPDGKTDIRKNEDIMTEKEIAGLAAQIPELLNTPRLGDIARAYTFKDTILGNMFIERKTDKTGKIVSIGDKIVNIKFSNYGKVDYNANVYSFDIDGRKVLYYKSKNGVVKCNYRAPENKKLEEEIIMSNTPWKGTEAPFPVIFVDSANSLLAINAATNERMVLHNNVRFDNSLKKSTITHEGIKYTLYKFSDHTDITCFGHRQYNCSKCGTAGYVYSEGKVYTPGETTYKTEDITIIKTSTDHFDNRKTTQSTTTTVKTKVEGKGSYENRTSKVTCDVCNGKGGTNIDTYLKWDGKSWSVR